MDRSRKRNKYAPEPAPATTESSPESLLESGADAVTVISAGSPAADDSPAG
jgi:hypothetical protein